MAALAPYPRFRAFTAGSNTSPVRPLVGGLLWAYAAGTTTLKDTYTDESGAIANPNPVELDARGEANIWLGDGAYKFVLTDKFGIQQGGAVDNISAPEPAGTAAALIALLTAAQIKLADVDGFFSGVTDVEAALKRLANPIGPFAVAGVSVLKHIPQNLWPSILDGTSTDDHYNYLQVALNAEPNLVLVGKLNSSATLIPIAKAPQIRAARRGGATLTSLTAGINLIQYPYDTEHPVLENIHFAGPAAAYVTNDQTSPGALKGYLVQPIIRHNDFDYDATACLDFDHIRGLVEDNIFGAAGAGSPPAAGTSPCIAMRFHSIGTNFTNINRIISNLIFFCGTTTQASVDIAGGTGWEFNGNDWEGGGQCLAADNIQLFEFSGTNWAERCNAAGGGLFKFRHTITNPIIRKLYASDNTCRSIVEYSVGETSGLEITKNLWNLTSTTFSIFDTTGGAAALPADGSVAFYGNSIDGGYANNPCVSETDFRGGPISVRINGSVTTAGGSITLFTCSDPGATANWAAAGFVTITASHPIAASAAKVIPGYNSSTGFGRVVKINATQFQTQSLNSSGAGIDGTLDFSLAGN